MFLKTLKVDQMHMVSKITQGASLVLLWKFDFDLRVVDSSSLNHIKAIINDGVGASAHDDFFWVCSWEVRLGLGWSGQRV